MVTPAGKLQEQSGCRRLRGDGWPSVFTVAVVMVWAVVEVGSLESCRGGSSRNRQQTGQVDSSQSGPHAQSGPHVQSRKEPAHLRAATGTAMRRRKARSRQIVRYPGSPLRARMLRELSVSCKDRTCLEGKSWSSVTFDPQGQYLVAGHDSLGAYAWEVGTWSLVRTYNRLKNLRHIVVVGESGLVLEGTAARTKYATMHPTMHAWRLNQPRWWRQSRSPRYERAPSTVLSVCIAPRNKFAVIAERARRVAILDPLSLWVRRVVRLPHCPATVVACPRDGEHVLVGCWGGAVISLGTRQHFRKVRRASLLHAAVSALAPVPGTSKVVIGTYVGAIWIWDYRSGSPASQIRRRYSLDVDDARVWALDARHQGDWFAVASHPDGVVLYDVKTGKRVLRIWDKSWKTPYALKFSPDGKLLAVGYGDGKLRVFQIRVR